MAGCTSRKRNAPARLREGKKILMFVCCRKLQKLELSVICFRTSIITGWVWNSAILNETFTTRSCYHTFPNQVPEGSHENKKHDQESLWPLEDEIGVLITFEELCSFNPVATAPSSLQLLSCTTYAFMPTLHYQQM